MRPKDRGTYYPPPFVSFHVLLESLLSTDTDRQPRVQSRTRSNAATVHTVCMAVTGKGNFAACTTCMYSAALRYRDSGGDGGEHDDEEVL